MAGDDVDDVDVGAAFALAVAEVVVDVTEATRKGGTVGMWTLAGRSDL